MKQKTLLFFVMTALVTSLQAQEGKSSKSVTGYAITASEKGGRSWREVRMVDINSGAELKTIYSSKAETEALNARTGKPVVKKDNASQTTSQTFTTTIDKSYSVTTVNGVTVKKVVNLDQELDKANGNQSFHKVVIVRTQGTSVDKPFSTNSAAMAYDKKHERLYYTPMGIAQLRYIDLKSGKIYYFEDEAFGVVKNNGDAANQITRMVIASDGDGYALTNDGNHLIRFTTGKKPVITDLGPLSDDGANAKFSVHGGGGYGGDMVADASENLYLVTANRQVFKIDIKTKAASYKGAITGLPKGFSTNGAMVEEGSKVIIASSESTTGYFRFDLNTLVAEKVSESSDVFNASDLANGNLAFDKKKKEQKEEAKNEPKPTAVEQAVTEKGGTPVEIVKNGIAVYPNPVTEGFVRLSFAEQPAGRYQVQLLDLSGRLISTKEVNINGKSQIEEFRFPELSVKGNYFVRVTNEPNKISITNKIVVQ